MVNELTKSPIVDKLCDTLGLLNGFLSKKYTIYQIVNSPNFIAFLKSFKSKVFGFLLKSKLFELDKIKKNFLYFFQTDSNALNSLIKG